MPCYNKINLKRYVRHTLQFSLKGNTTTMHIFQYFSLANKTNFIFVWAVYAGICKSHKGFKWNSFVSRLIVQKLQLKVLLLYPLKTSKTFILLMFSGLIGEEHWLKIC